MYGVGQTERERAELAKLRLEARQIEADLDERKDKRRYEKSVDNAAWMRYTISIILALLVPVGGWVITTRGQQSTETVAIIQRDDDLYYRILEAFGSSSSAARQGAAAALGSYAKMGLHSHEHATETSALLANRLTTETDGGVLDEVITSLSSLPATSIPEVVRANRIASLQYSRALGRAVALRSIAETDQGLKPSDALTRRVRGEIYAEVSGIGTLLERDPVNPESTLDLTYLMVAKRLHSAYESERQRVLASADIAPKRGRDAAPAAVRQLEDSVRSLAATSTALAQLMRTNSGMLTGADLRDIVILDADLRNLDLRFVDFSSANLEGSAVGSDFSFSDLSGAAVSKLAFRDALGQFAKMRAADIDGTIFSLSNIPDLRGSYWWRARRDLSTDLDETSTGALQLESMYHKEQAIKDCTRLRIAANVSARPCSYSG
jgi:Pentapeptide repeats (8 copies)